MVEAEIVPATGNLCLEPPPTTKCMAGPSREPSSIESNRGHCVGFLRSTGPRGFQAYDAAGQLIGLFHDKQAAIEAITAPNSTGD
jgi:hypothetical protein